MELAEPRRGDAQSATGNRMRRSQPHGSWKNGRKRSLLVDGIGVPLSLVVSGANTHDVKLLEATLDQVVMEMPGRAGQCNLCADAGYKGAPASNAGVELDYKPHIKQRREESQEKQNNPGFRVRLRKNGGQLCRSSLARRCHDLLETNYLYIRISLRRCWMHRKCT